MIVFYIVMFPILLVISPFNWWSRKNFDKKYKAYLQSIDGKNFFCYNNRRNGHGFIVENILPKLPGHVETIYLDGKEVQSDYEQKFISNAFYEFKNYARFPHLLKIRNGKVVDCSINSEVFQCMNQGAEETVVFSKIEVFFEWHSIIKT